MKIVNDIEIDIKTDMELHPEIHPEIDSEINTEINTEINLEINSEINTSGPVALTIGKFDGLHRGHMELIDRIIAMKKQGFRSMVLTFDPSPEEFFTGRSMPVLTTAGEKISMLERLGVDYLYNYPMNETSAAVAPEEFVRDILFERIGCRYIAAGEDISFGRGGTGDRDLILEMSEKLHFSAEIIPKLRHGDRIISSTYIKEALEAGDMELVENLAGRPYSFRGNVVHGNQLGRKMGFPTANIIPEPLKALPPRGVYFSEVNIEGRLLRGITNIGIKPTVVNDDTVIIETNIFDLNEDIYGREIEVSLLHFHRPERRFASVAELERQLGDDVREGIRFDKIR